MRSKILIGILCATLGTSGISARADTIGDSTRLSGKMYFDFTQIDQTHSDSGKTDASGLGLDVKRFYLGIDHAFNDVWSANLTTDFNYVSSDKQTNLLVKKAYVQGHFSNAAVLRIGSAGTPWIGLVEDYYGYRYVENTLVDRLKFGNSADWGLHLGGDLGASKRFNYAVSMVNGAGYKHATRSEGMDVVARVGFVPMQGMIIAMGTYSGKRGQATQTHNALHTASRANMMVAYANQALRLGSEYFQAKNWNTVLTPISDKAVGWSLWGSVNVADDIDVFARHDHADLSKDIDPTASDTYTNVGVQLQVSKGFKLAAVYKHEKREGAVAAPLPAHVANTRTNEIGVWGEVKF
ncbi:MAG: carbohydrate porin [Xanthomonadales bacterium]|nr:carbohydrate porin [Xanthomonadales bacterium]